MTKEEKDLLLKDLCARLPYRIKASYYGAEEECECIDTIDAIYWVVKDRYEVVIGQYDLPIEKVKPYLFPLSSMTEEQEKEFYDTYYGFGNYDWSLGTYDWLNKNHFDYRGLIEKGLALDATNLKYMY